jgi:hypothetical protein
MIGTTQLINAFGGPASTTDNVDYPVTNLACYKLDNTSKSETSSAHYLFIGDAGNSSSSGRLNSVDAEFTYTRPTGYSEWGGSWDPSNKAGSATQTFEESNKKWTKSGTYYNAVWSTNKYHSGKYYAEIEFLGVELIYGISMLTTATGYSTSLQNSSVYYGSWATHSWKYSTTNTAEGAILSTNDVIGLAADFDNQILQVYRNNVLLDTVSIAAPNGTDTNVEYRAGKFGQAAVFNGSNSKITISGSPFNITTYSLSFWINAATYNQSTTSIINIGLDNTGGAWSGLAFGVNANKVFYYGGDVTGVGGTGFFTQTGTTSITNGAWVHIAIIVNGTAVTGYVNGTQDSGLSRTLGANITYRGGSINTIGVRSGAFGSYGYWNGSVDQFRVFSSALSASQVTQLYNEIPETDTSNFKAVLYTGNDGGSNNTSQLINNVGFRPDLVWIKNREHTYNHILMDSVRGDDLILHSNTNDVSSSAYGGSLAIEDTGFTTGKGDETNKGLANYNKFVAWCWKGGGNAVTDNSGAVSAEVSANTGLGFSIVKYNDSGTGGQTVAHGLNSPPEIMITKTTDTATDWFVYTTLIDGGMDYLKLNTLAAAASSSLTVPTSDFIYSRGQSSTSIINYLFHSVTGVSKMGTYTGATGNKTVTIGFRPSFVIIKNTSTASAGNWNMMDSRRDTSNPIELNLWADTNGTEATASQSNVYDVDFDATGFTIKNNYIPFNQNGEEYIYMAFK